MIHVGNEVSKKSSKLEPQHYLTRKMLLGNRKATFLKHDIINADSQMQSLEKCGIEIEYGHISDRKSISSLLQAGLEIRRRTGEGEVDLVHVLWGSTTGLITCLFSRKPVVVSFCGSDLLGAKRGDGSLSPGGRINRIISGWVARLADWNITKSKVMAEVLPVMAQSKTSVIPNGVNLSGFYPLDIAFARARLGWENGRKYVLFFYTRGQNIKDPGLAKGVFNLIKKEMPQVKLITVTEVPHEELLYYYNSADLMLLTSLHEGSNNSLKEARACNLPIVSVNVGDAHERLSKVKNCAVIESRSPKDLKNAAVSILKSGNRSSGAEHSKDLAIDRIADQIARVYNNLLSVK